jgi:hypothetical protein
MFAVGKTMYEQAKGNTARARTLFKALLQDQPALAAKLQSQAFDIAIGQAVERAHVLANNAAASSARQAERLAFSTPRMVQARERGVAQAAKINEKVRARRVAISDLGRKLFEYALPGGQKLADATKSDLQTAAATLLLPSRDRVADGFWLQAIADKLTGTQTVKESGLSWETLNTLKTRAAERAQKAVA